MYTGVRCCKCKQIKDRSEYWACKVRKNGLQPVCKQCTMEYRNQPEVREKFRETWRKYSKSKAGRLRDSKRAIAKNIKYYEKYPARKLAVRAISNALRSKRITMKPCEVCGSKKSHAHHDDYRKYFDVRWLCSIHHTAEHRRLEAIGHDFHG